MQAPIYATMPVHRMGQLALREACLSRAAESDFTAFSLADVDAAFGTITQLRWRQTVSLTGVLCHATCMPMVHFGAMVWQV